MKHIRQARAEDAARLAEIEIFNYRLNFYPIFRSDEFYFGELQVPALMQDYADHPEKLACTRVYDDGAVKGFARISGDQIEKLFVEPVLQGQGIGARLLDFALEQGCTRLWALEKNARAIRFYQRHGFFPTGNRALEDDTDEFLVELALQ